MKIYFEDGRLKKAEDLPAKYDHEIDAKNGYSDCHNIIEDLAKRRYQDAVYTNFLPALNNRYAWNAEEKVPEIYIRRSQSDDFVRIDTLTTRELKEGHNIMKMYMANEFGNLG